MKTQIKFRKDQITTATGPKTLYHVTVDGRYLGSVTRKGDGWTGSMMRGWTVDGRTRADVAAIMAEEAPKPTVASNATPTDTAHHLCGATSFLRGSALRCVLRLGHDSDHKYAIAAEAVASKPTASYALACIDCSTALKVSTPHVGDRCEPCHAAMVRDMLASKPTVASKSAETSAGVFYPFAPSLLRHPFQPLPAPQPMTADRRPIIRVEVPPHKRNDSAVACASCGVATGAFHPLWCLVYKPTGGSVLVTILAFGLVLCAALTTGACAGTTNGQRDAYARIGTLQAHAIVAATAAIHAVHNDATEDGDGDEDGALLRAENVLRANAARGISCGRPPGDVTAHIDDDAHRAMHAYCLGANVAPDDKEECDGHQGDCGCVEAEPQLIPLCLPVTAPETVLPSEWHYTRSPSDVFVDRIEGDNVKVAVVMFADGVTANVPLSVLPVGTVEGSWIALGHFQMACSATLCPDLIGLGFCYTSNCADESCSEAQGADSCVPSRRATRDAINRRDTAKRARLGASDPGGTIYLDRPSLPSSSAASERATVQATTNRKPLPIGAETILAACPVAFDVTDDGRGNFHFYCDATGTQVTIFKSTVDAGLSAGTIGNPSASWVR